MTILIYGIVYVIVDMKYILCIDISTKPQQKLTSVPALHVTTLPIVAIYSWAIHVPVNPVTLGLIVNQVSFNITGRRSHKIVINMRLG